MKRFSRFPAWLTLASVLVASSASVSAQPAPSRDRAAAGLTKAKPIEDVQSIDLPLTIPNKSPNPCNIDYVQVTDSLFVVGCKVQNTHGGDQVKRFAFATRSSATPLLLETVLAARAEKKTISIEFDTETRRNLDGCPKKECRNIISIKW